MGTIAFSGAPIPGTQGWTDWTDETWLPGVSPVSTFNGVGFEFVPTTDAQLLVIQTGPMAGYLLRLVGDNTLSIGGDFATANPTPFSGLITGFQLFDRYEHVLIFDDPNNQVLTFSGPLWDGVLLAAGGGYAIDAAAIDAAADPGAALLAAFLGGDNTIAGSASNDILMGMDGVDVLAGGAGNDTLDGGANPELGEPGAQGDFLLGGEGDATYIIDSGLDLADEGILFPDFGFGGVDTIISKTDFYWDVQSVGEILRVAEDVNDVGGDGVTIVGGVFNNTLEGHSGTDIMFGRGGADVYRGGDGIDFMSLSLLGTDGAYPGIDGVNTVIVEKRQSGTFSYDIVFEFESGKDKFDVSDYGFKNRAEAFATGVNDGAGSSYFILGDGLDYLYVVGRTLDQLSENDFMV